MPALASWLGLTLLKGTLVLTAALLLGVALRRAPGGARHRLWSLAFAALLALPLLAVALPSLPVPVPDDVLALLPSGAVGEGTPILPASPSDGNLVRDHRSDDAAGSSGLAGDGQTGPHDRSAGSDSRAALPRESLDATISRSGDDAAILRSGDDASARDGSTRAGGAPRPGVTLVATGRALITVGAALRPHLSSGLLVAWVAGFLVAAALLAAGLARGALQIRRARPLDDEGWRRDLEWHRNFFGIRRPVRLLESPQARTPMTTGWWRPVVLVPPGAAGWSFERRRVVLLHELVHIRRCDVARHLLARLCVALYWFHPLAWLAGRSSSIAREQACDEEVLRLGVKPSVYAAHLLELAATLRPGPAPAAALPMIQRSQLEERLMRILDADRTPRAAWTSAVVTGLMVLAAISASVAAPAVQGPAPVAPVPPAEIAAPAAQLAALAEQLAVQVEQLAVQGEQLAVQDGQLVDQQERLAAQAAELAVVAPDLVARVPALAALVPGLALQIPDLAVPAAELGALARTLGAVAAAPVFPGQADACWPEGESRIYGRFSGTFSSSDADGRRVVNAVGERDGDRIVQRWVDDLRLCMLVRGEVELEDGGARIGRLAEGASVVLEAELDGRLQRLVLRNDGGGEQATWTVDGQTRPVDATVQNWRDQMTAALADYARIMELRGERSSLRGQISSIRGQRSSLRGQISSIRGQRSSLRGQISSLHGRESSLRGEISSARGQVSSLRGQISSARGQVSSLNGQISSHRSALRGLEASRYGASQEELAVIDAAARRHEEAMRELEQQIEDYDLEARVAELERQIEQYGLDDRVAEIETRVNADIDGQVAEIEEQIAALDVEGRVAEIEQQIEALDVEGKVREIEEQIEALNVDERVQEIEERLEPALRELRRTIEAIGR